MSATMLDSPPAGAGETAGGPPPRMRPRHFLDLTDHAPETLREILTTAADLKTNDPRGRQRQPLAGRTLALIFEKPSTRTRVSFEVGMRQLGGSALMLSSSELQLGRGETIADTARVLSRYVDGIMIRTAGEERLRELADNATVPVINGLTDASHPCQLMADILTFEEHCGPIQGRRIAWMGDGNNMAMTWIHAAVAFDFELTLACPEPLQPPPALLDWARHRGGRISVSTDPAAMAHNADAVVTDTWVSMGDKDAASRHNLLQPYQVTADLMGRAKESAIFMHCLPAHRGEEVTAEVIDGPRSVVWDEAENRLHAQKGILVWCLG